MAVTRFYLDLRGKAKDGKGSLLITIFHNRSTATIPTGIRLSPSEWNGSRVQKVSASNALNAKLSKQKSEIDKAIAFLALEDNFDVMSATEIKAEISHGKLKKISGHLISDLFVEYMSHGMKENTRGIYINTLKKVKSFSGETTKIESINLKWLNSFDTYLSKTQTLNGRAIYLRALRAVCNYARHTGVIDTYPFENFQIRQESTRKRSVSVELLQTFRDYPTTKSNSYYRDYFFLMFYLIGINAKDLLLAKPEQIVNGRLEYIREKTGKKYSIKIEPEARELLDKYAGTEHLVEALDHCMYYKSFLHEMNNALRLIGETYEEEVNDSLFDQPKKVKKVNPVIPGISSYYARHTWATLAYELGIQMDTISQALGHSFGNRTTLIYIKSDQDKVDAANRKVLDLLL